MRTFDAASLEKIKSLGQYDAGDLPTGADHCSCPDPVCTGSAAGTSVGAGRGAALCYLYADSRDPSFKFYTYVRDPLNPSSSARLGCLGQGGNDPLSQTLNQLYQNHAAQVEMRPVVAPTTLVFVTRHVTIHPPVNLDVLVACRAHPTMCLAGCGVGLRNDQFESTADSHYADVCAYSSYSPEALPYTECTSDATCGKRCEKSASDYRACSSDADCASGDTCAQVRRRGQGVVAAGGFSQEVSARLARLRAILSSHGLSDTVNLPGAPAGPMHQPGAATLQLGLWQPRRALERRARFPEGRQWLPPAGHNAKLPGSLARSERRQRAAPRLSAREQCQVLPVLHGAVSQCCHLQANSRPGAPDGATTAAARRYANPRVA